MIGLTRSGKTVATRESLLGFNGGALFFNTQHEQMPKEFIRVDGSYSLRQLKQAIDKGYKLNFVPDNKLILQRYQLAKIIDSLYDSKVRNMVLVVDEVHLFNDKSCKESLIQVATTGLRFGIQGAWISQRPAKIENTLMTQSNKFIIFQMNMEFAYLKGHHIPGEEIARLIDQGGKFSYVEFDWRKLDGPFRV